MPNRLMIRRNQFIAGGVAATLVVVVVVVLILVLGGGGGRSSGQSVPTSSQAIKTPDWTPAEEDAYLAQLSSGNAPVRARCVLVATERTWPRYADYAAVKRIGHTPTPAEDQALKANTLAVLEQCGLP